MGFWMTFGIFRRRAAILLLPLLLAACPSMRADDQAVQTTPEPNTTGTVKNDALQPLAPDATVTVALLAPLSGPQSELGEALLNAAQMAVFDLSKGDLQLRIYDTGGRPEAAGEAARRALAEGAKLILGPLFSSSTSVVSPLAGLQQIPVISFSNDASVAGAGVFVLGIDVQQEVDRVVGFARAEGLRRFGVMAPLTPYGDLVVAAMQQSAARTGGEVTRSVRYDPNNPDYTEAVQDLADYANRRGALLARKRELRAAGDTASLRRLENRDTLGPPPFDAVLLASGGAELLQIAPLLPFYDVDPKEVRFLGTRLWENPALGNESTLSGAWFSAPQLDRWQAFRNRYRSLYGRDPHRLASLAYDGAALAGVLLGEAKARGLPEAYDLDSLTRTEGFAGVDGIFRLLPTGRSERGLAVLTFRRGAIEVLDPAPASFQPVIN